MKNIRALLGGFAVLFVALAPLADAVAQSAGDSFQAQRARWSKPMAPFRIIGNIYYVGTEGLAVYLIATPRGHVLLDAGVPESASQIEGNIQSLGFKLADVEYLLNSHAHFDHSGGLAQLKKATGATLIASEGDRSALEGGFYLGSEDNHALDAPPVKVDRVMADGETLSLAGTRLKANLTPGHTRGCTSWSMPVEHEGKSYQVLFFCSSSVAANRLAGPPQYPQIVADYETTFARAKTLRVDVFLAPHPEFYGMQEKRARLQQGGANPFIDPAEFPAFIAQSEADFRKQLAAAGQAPAR
jgi:metallo-beta-lactamase class B